MTLDFNPKYCFCTLALGEKYRQLTGVLAGDMERYAPSIALAVATDKPADFQHYNNVIAYPHYQRGILHCYNDKRIILEKSLDSFATAIFIDADTRFNDFIPDNLEFSPGLIGHHQKMIDHVRKYRPENVESIIALARKLAIEIDTVQWVGESLFAITRDGGKEREFFRLWERAARYLELRKMHSGEGNIIGLVGSKIGWQVTRNESLLRLDKVRKHLDISSSRKSGYWNNLNKKIGYQYRLNLARLIALGDYEFYYR